MTFDKTKTILQAGKQLAAVATEQVIRGEPHDAEAILNDARTERQGTETSMMERIARVLAGQRISINAEGYEQSASTEVDAEWHHYLGDALAVLKAIREPDSVMTAAGDPEAWTRIVEVAIADYEGRWRD